MNKQWVNFSSNCLQHLMAATAPVRWLQLLCVACHDLPWCPMMWCFLNCWCLPVCLCVCGCVCVPAFVQRNCNLKKMMEINPLEVERRMAEAIRHFDVEVARQRAAKGRKFLLEHPSSASSWNLPSVLQLCQEIPGCRFCCVAQCRYGLKSPGTNGNEKTHQVPDEQWCHLPGVLWQEMPVQKPRPCTPKNRGFHQWCEFEQICSNLSSSAGTSGSVMLPARVLEPLRPGWKGISLPGLSTQLVQPFVHEKKVKALDSCGAPCSTDVGKKQWSLKNKFFDGFLNKREPKKKPPDFLDEGHDGFSDGFCRTRFPTDFWT